MARRAKTPTESPGPTTGKIEIRRILCPIDFSDSSRLAMEEAVGLARLHKGEINALFVFPIVQPAVADVPYLPPQIAPDVGARSVVAKDLEEFLRPARAAGVPFRITLEAGDPARQILSVAGAASADVIVMGTHGRSGVERWLLGSVADKVLRRAPCPVITVAHQVEAWWEPNGFFKRVVCALDLSDASPRTLRHASSLARGARAHVTLLHVVAGLDEAKALVPYGLSQYGRRLEAQARARLHQLARSEAWEGCEIEEQVVTGKPYREILRIAREGAAGLIVMGTHGTSPLHRMFLGSTADHVVRAAACPVLTVRPEAE